MREINEHCLFHADRLRFDQLEKELKQSKWIPRNNCHRLASAVCSCRKNIDWESNTEELASHKQSFRAILDEENEKLSAYLTVFIRNILDSVTPTDFSRCRLLQILLQAQNDDYSFLSRSAICNNEKDSAAPIKAKSRPNKLTQNQFDCMVRKRKQKYDSEVVDLPMFPGNIKKLETKLGSNLVNYSKNERFIYEMKHQLNNRNFNNNVNTTYIEVWSKNQGAIKSIKRCLREKAIEAQRLAETQKENRKAIKQQRRAYFQSCLNAELSDEEEIYDAGIIYKDRLSKDFGLKMRPDKHTGKRNVKKSVLLGGHCFNCLSPFAGLKNSTGQNCVHHPGFIMRSKWSCCGQVVENILDLESEHSLTGCVEERYHNYKPHKKANRKPKREMLHQIKTVS